MLSRLFILLSLALGIFLWWQDRREHRYDAEIVAAAKRYQVSPALVKAVVWQESRFDADVRGRAGEIGLMQIRKTAAQEWATAEHLPRFQHEEIFDPGKNTLAGAWYLAKLLKRYRATDDPLPYALADYNAGRGNVLKWNSGIAATNSAAFIEKIGFPTTKAYVESVRKKYASLKAEM